MRRLTRRDVVQIVATALGFTSAYGFVHWLSRARRAAYPMVRRPYQALPGLLRPPGALPEPDFLAACIRCYRCQDACEPGAIQFYSESDGDLFHTPYVDPAKSGCTLCNRCGPACPTGALVPFAEMKDVRMGSVELREDLCLSYKAKAVREQQELLVRVGLAPTDVDAAAERRGPCGECYTYCPLRNQGIRLAPGAFLAPVVFTEHCVGCGMCEDICRVVVRGEPAIRVVRTRRRVGWEEAA